MVKGLRMAISVSLALLAGCQEPAAPGKETAKSTLRAHKPTDQKSVPRDVYFGDLHIHSRWSFDAYSLAVPVGPESAYRYARGEAIPHVSGKPIALKGPPLDFIALTEHSEYMGVSATVDDPESPLRVHPLIQALTDPDPAVSGPALSQFAASLSGEGIIEDLVTDAVIKPTWKRLVDLANAEYRPGEFTTFVGYEYTSMPSGQNLHRNVLFRGAAAPDRPFSSFDSPDPADLWAWMDATRAEGYEVMAIPHNANASNGLMYPDEDADGNPLSRSYIEQRIRNEPVSEVMQIKGQSETHPVLSTDDEWARFDMFDRVLGQMETLSQPDGSYARDALKMGLAHEARTGVNPYAFGMIGSSDSHNASSPVEEYNYTGKIGVADGTPEARFRGIPPGLPGEAVSMWGAAGLAGVWAEANTREAIFDALARREVFATSGPRIRLRTFAAPDFSAGDAAGDLAEVGYSQGVPMGGRLAPGSTAATIVAVALRDPMEAPLERLQVIKGWLEAGDPVELVVDIACAGGVAPDAASGRCPIPPTPPDPDCRPGPGADELHAFWRDPDFDTVERAFYYVRVLQVPTCRWSTFDAARLGREVPAHLPRAHQERAVSSPIWYSPAAR